MFRTDIVIIGAGASGLMLGALMPDRDFVIIDHNPNVGAKMLVSGGGRCNITNDKLKPKNYLGNQRFVRNIIKRFDQNQLLSWLGQRGLVPQMRKNNQYFCKTSAKEIVDLLKREIDRKKFRLDTKVERVEKKDGLFEVYSSRGVFQAKQVVVASGGLSFPKLGATSIGYDIASSFGHTIHTLKAGLVGFTVQPEQFFFKLLSGISTEVKIRVGEKEIEGSLLFAHKGISGPAVLDASLYWEKGKISIDFLSNLNIEQLKMSKRNISNILGIPSRVAKAFLVELKIEDKKANQLTASEWREIEGLKEYSFAPAGSFGYSKAEVTKGGIDSDEIDASSMMSREVEGLYFVGEVLDVTGELGGYNFQWAFSTAFVCSKAIM
ncbi:aminoacetone oxidase family FAD-binding enzyme [Sulfurovum sp. bin170]|uniref:NAD(P)/FAD-dependent oxidoreductase n=1 Tax=Sulfurovum sp. bin170 TaxID=2695268 RepID=UPI0013E00E5D|nr:aminoacetone oxidase family FAD-binding enzyme [Sulfurovum sp. bin170]NEW61729.1 aminoacetone oxidase family FAD-binding enzyme [Sulfurovum sp. bin170]